MLIFLEKITRFSKTTQINGKLLKNIFFNRKNRFNGKGMMLSQI